ncbi:MAG TPA: CHAT domain-containing protein [Chitinophagaceae bacterium]
MNTIDLPTAAKNNMNGDTRFKMKLLLVSASPVDNNPLKPDRELREIEQAIWKCKYRDSITIRKFQGLRIADLQHELLTWQPTHVHFSGHGNTNGIALVDDQDNTQLVRFEPLAELFRLLSGQITCVFLNSCCSASQSRLLGQYIPYTVCMAGEIHDDAATRFAVGYYAAIGAGNDEAFSFKWALNSMALNETGDEHIPYLFTNTKDPHQ